MYSTIIRWRCCTVLQSAEASKIHSNAQPNIASGKRRGKQIETFREQLAREVEELGVCNTNVVFFIIHVCLCICGHTAYYVSIYYPFLRLLGATLLTGKEKKEYEARKMMRLGGKAPKNLKTPIKILQGMRTKEAERAQKKREEVSFLLFLEDSFDIFYRFLFFGMAF